MSKDPELDAMEIITAVMEPLNEETQRRMSVWIWDRYGPPMTEITGEVIEFDQ